MNQILEAFHNHFQKIGFMIHTLTKMDVRITNLDGTMLVQQVHHEIPAVLQYLHEDFSVINGSLENHPSNRFIHYVNAYDLGYIAAGIWDKGEFCGSIAVGHIVGHSFNGLHELDHGPSSTADRSADIFMGILRVASGDFRKGKGRTGRFAYPPVSCGAYSGTRDRAAAEAPPYGRQNRNPC
ncbi:hypothetical protein [Paenibacillus dokdonensis]|uniref:hypothetical protein n=1 Tax=Paenibacillus dokdonensis TaxID=2567944 RepID=UPI001457B8F0|nr:hypothetical protein [Paenibacillus dokdonensis]